MMTELLPSPSPSPSICSKLSYTLDRPPSCIEFSPVHSSLFVVGTYRLTSADSESSQPSHGNINENVSPPPPLPQQRDGSLMLFNLVLNESTTASSDNNSGVPVLKLLHTVPLPYTAVLDLHFHPHAPHRDVLAVATSCGVIRLFRLGLTCCVDTEDVTQQQGQQWCLSNVATVALEGAAVDHLVLSCTWDAELAGVLAATTSVGGVYVGSVPMTDLESIVGGSGSSCAVGNDGSLKLRAVPGHEKVETWTVAFAPRGKVLGTCMRNDRAAQGGKQEVDGTVLLLSSDDLGQIVWGSVEVPSTLQTEKPIRQYVHQEDQKENQYEADEGESVLNFQRYRNIEGHEVGVTALLPLGMPHDMDGHGNQQLLVTGSFDEKIRAWAVKPPGGRQNVHLLGELGLEGGVWRLKVIRSQRERKSWTVRILASCMHAGARIIDLTGRPVSSEKRLEWSFTEIARFQEHKSMNYASDFVPLQNTPGRLIFVSTSFYDKLLCVWEAP